MKRFCKSLYALGCVQTRCQRCVSTPTDWLAWVLLVRDLSRAVDGHVTCQVFPLLL